ncbi:hypothetical protein, partial [uncultured Gammaproteobacteria bacterium]
MFTLNKMFLLMILTATILTT